MARTSRKKLNPSSAAPVLENAAAIFRAGCYARLSLEDNGRDDSDSLENQLNLLEQFAAQNPELEIIDTYIDNGATGTNFERSEFGRLMEDVRSGRINCILVKDLSRFGRNYVETGQLLDIVLPALGVRFIAVNDSLDTLDASSAQKLDVRLKNLINDYYARDISRKECSAMKSKRLRGEYIGNYAPYGYLKDPKDKNHLIVDPVTAPTVRMIYQWRDQGMKYGAILKRLNELDIPSPGRYRFENGIITNNNKKGAGLLWTRHAVTILLSNELYIGNMVQGKSSSCLHQGVAFHWTQPHEWDRVENTHEPIVDRELFQRVQCFNEEERQRHLSSINRYPELEKAENPYGKKMVCGSCGRVIKLYRNIGKGGKRAWFTYICPSNHDLGAGTCPLKAIPKQELDQAVLTVLKKQMQLVLRKEKQLAQLIERARVEEAASGLFSQKRERQLQKLIDQRSKAITDLYADWKSGLFDQEEYALLKGELVRQREDSEKELEMLRSESEKRARILRNRKKISDLVEKYYDCREVTPEIVAAFIQKLQVEKDGSLKITLKYRDELKELESLCEILKKEVA